MTKTTGHSTHKYAAVPVGQRSTWAFFAGGITADGVADLVPPYSNAVRE